MGHDEGQRGDDPGCTGCGACGNGNCAGTGRSALSGEDRGLPAPFDLTILLAQGTQAGAPSSLTARGSNAL